MGYDHGDSFPFDFEPNGFPFGLKSKVELFPRSNPIQLERKWNTSFLSIHTYKLTEKLSQKGPVQTWPLQIEYVCFWLQYLH